MQSSVLSVACVVSALALPSAVHAASSTPMASTRVEFTRPGGVPGAARDIAGASDRYMIAPGQPDASGISKKRKRR